MFTRSVFDAFRKGSGSGKGRRIPSQYEDIGKGFHYHLEKFDENGVFIGLDEMVKQLRFFN